MKHLLLILGLVSLSTALQCYKCHTRKHLRLPGVKKVYTNIMQLALHTGIMTMTKKVLENPKNNFPGWEKFPLCENKVIMNCTEGEVCGYNEMHHRYFTRHCVNLKDTLYHNITVNKCYVHGMLLHKTTFNYCDKDLCNEKEIPAAAAAKCETRTWKMTMEGMATTEKTDAANTTLPPSSESPSISQQQLPFLFLAAAVFAVV